MREIEEIELDIDALVNAVKAVVSQFSWVDKHGKSQVGGHSIDAFIIKDGRKFLLGFHVLTPDLEEKGGMYADIEYAISLVRQKDGLEAIERLHKTFPRIDEEKIRFGDVRMSVWGD